MKLAVFLLGLLLAILSHPKILGPVVSRLANEGIVTQRPIPRRDAEVIKHAGPNLSLFFIGLILILLGIII